MTTAVLLLCWAHVATGEGVYTISDGATLKQYLCPGNGTLPPNTNLVLSEPRINVSSSVSKLCLVENTTNITISPSKEVFAKGYQYVEVYCVSNKGIGVGFFNVSNLTISSVIFFGCGATITPEAVKFVNETHQYLYYDYQLPVAIFFNHCFDVKIYNLSFGCPHHTLSIPNCFMLMIGVNLCGTSEIINFLPAVWWYELQTVLLYFIDSNITSSLPDLECNLTVVSNTISHFVKRFSPSRLMDTDDRLLIDYDNLIGDFALFLAQSFAVDATLNVGPHTALVQLDSVQSHSAMSVVIGFINAATNSQVILNGHGLPYETCLKEEAIIPPDTHWNSIQSLEVVVVFYERLSFDHERKSIPTSLIIKDTSFTSHYSQSNNVGIDAATLLITKLTRKLSHEVMLENISWCYNNLLNTDQPIIWYLPIILKNWFFVSPFVANSTSSINNFTQGELHLKLKNLLMHQNLVLDEARRKRSNCLMCFTNVNVTMTGTNYFANNSGGSVIGVVASNLTVSGDLTIKDGYAYKGGAINLDSTSTLYLKEPLVARFYNNSAYSGSAIYAPVRLYGEKQSAIQIWPIKQYSLNNLTSINISMHFGNNNAHENQVPRSFYAPHFSFFGEQTSPYFDFKSDTWDIDSHLPQYAYTTLIDAILHMDKVDKFISLANGLCVQLSKQKFSSDELLKCNYIDEIVYRSQPITNDYIPYSTRVHPGDTILTVVHGSGQILDIWYYEEQGESMENFKPYKYFEVSVLPNNYYYSVKYNYVHSFNDSTGYYVVRLTDVDTNLFSIPFLQFYRLDCPIGFCLIKEGICYIDPILSDHGYANPGSDTEPIFIPTGYWTGIIETKVMFANTCPPNFCGDNTDQNLTQTCVGNRKGILCGECQDGLSVMLGSDACSSDCTDVYLLTLPVYALAGLLLVLVLFVLRLTVATGTINGVIFYANILGLVMDKLTATENINIHYKMFLRVFISLLNLDLGFPLCLYEGMTTVGKVGLQFVFPVYLWSIVIALILLAKFSTRVSNLISKSSVQVLATLFYLSFSKLLRTAIVIFSPSTIYVIKSCGNYTSSLVWYFDGHDYGHSTHAVLLTLAVIFTLIFLLPYALLVTFSSFLVRFRVVNRFKPFIDAYGGPFKDKWRFWFGLRLWITILLFGLDGALEEKNAKIMFTAHNIIFMLFILLQAFVRPFKNSLVGLVDISFMANYWLLVASLFWTLNNIFSVMYYFLTSAAVLTIVSILNFNYLYLKYQDSLKKLNNAKAGYQAIQRQASESSSDDELFRAAKDRARPTY